MYSLLKKKFARNHDFSVPLRGDTILKSKGAKFETN